jgi:UDP-N-acetylmuramate--alanine ligase
VLEADESDRSLMRFRPDWSVVTNASRDHFSLGETRRLFAAFSSGTRVGCVDAAADPSILDGFSPVVEPAGSRFMHGGVAFRVGMPGRHNAANALLAVMLCERLGYDLTSLAEAMAAFSGIVRRLETVRTGAGVTVIDDYAHNPAKIRAAWDAVAPHHRRVLGIWQPHGFGPLRAMMDDLVLGFRACCRAADRVLILPVYDAGGTADRSVRSDELVRRLAGAGLSAEAVPSQDDLLRRVGRIACDGDAVLLMGARDPALPGLARRLAGLV